MIITISGPSGTGKTSLAQEVMRKNSRFRETVSHTTRSPRPDESDGVHYRFVDEAVFKATPMVESAFVFGYWYGTSEEEIFSILRESSFIISVVDPCGAEKLSQWGQVSGVSVQSVYLKEEPEVLKHRLLDRRDNPETIAERINRLEKEMAWERSYAWNYVFGPGGSLSARSDAILELSNF